MALNWENAFGPRRLGDAGVLLGLLGSGIGNSRTPSMHLAEAAALGLSCAYRLLDTDYAVGTVDLGEVLDRVEAAGYTGINVTFPYKQDVIAHLHEVRESADKVGAVNTVLFRDGRRIGENTDYSGFRKSLSLGLPGVGLDRVLLIGAGGAGGAVAAALIDEGTGRLLIHDRDTAKAADLAHRLGDRAEVVSEIGDAAASADGVVNATPVGMDKLPGLPLPEGMIAPDHWVGDTVYFPLDTALLKAARAKGCRVLPGSGMALYQAVHAFELFTGISPDPRRMWAAFEAAG